uniref:Uncharacterized protein n=1 Tax=Trichobilharzia regenti TaxID=157069 RepID=A0AA85JAZ4_TRIRE|nr:unnamed protein product [Trichobilharzia regenti]
MWVDSVLQNDYHLNVLQYASITLTFTMDETGSLQPATVEVYGLSFFPNHLGICSLDPGLQIAVIPPYVYASTNMHVNWCTTILIVTFSHPNHYLFSDSHTSERILKQA